MPAPDEGMAAASVNGMHRDAALRRMLERVTRDLGAFGLDLAGMAGSVEEIASRSSEKLESFERLNRAGMRAARNENPVLMQIYRRDMGGGNFVVMKEVDAPITVQGRRRGTLRLACKL